MNCRTLPTLVALFFVSACGGGSTPPAAPYAEPVQVLFVGNSYTFGRGTAALSFNAANVSDLTTDFNNTSPAGGSYPVGTGLPPTPCKDTTGDVGCYSPHPWGGVPGIFKSLTDEAGLFYFVSISARSAATMRGHFLNTADAAWNLRGNIASKKWDVVVLQGQSDEPLPRAKSKNGNPVSWSTYANQIAQYIRSGEGAETTEAAIFGGVATCTGAVTANPAGAGLTATVCNTPRSIPRNTNANPNAKVFLMQTWARPDMVEPHKCVDADNSTMIGGAIVDPTCSNGSNGSRTTGMNTLYYTARATTPENLADMTNDMNAAFTTLAATKRTTGDALYAGVLPVGNAFQRAITQGVAKGTGFYKADGTFSDAPGLTNLWFSDLTHASVYGYYLSALVSFATITGLDPTMFKGADRAAAGLKIEPSVAAALQTVAKQTVLASGYTLK